MEIINRPALLPWQEGDNIPWNEPRFSQAMLKEHLSQEHDAASRRFATIDRHVQFIHQRCLRGQPARILDLGCGPGLYLERLARLGHTGQGIDFSPASIEYARQTARHEGLPCDYQLADLRQADYGSGFDLAMLLFGEFNVFDPADARLILQKAWTALKPGAMLLLEPSTEASLRRQAMQATSWYTSQGGLFSDRPHLVLNENAWNEELKALGVRYMIVDAHNGQVTRSSVSYQAYSEQEIRALLESCAFEQISIDPALTGEDEGAPQEFMAVSAIKKR